MHPLNRRDLISGVLAGAAVGTLVQAASADGGSAVSSEAAPTAQTPERPWRVIDTNVHLCQWPFRRLPCDTLPALLAKLQSLGIDGVWAGSFEGLLHRDVSAVNQRLAETCRREGSGRLLPFGSVNLELPDWEEDLRRCHEQHRMPGIRLHPNYHGYGLDDPRFARMLAMAAERKLLVQLAASMEDRRTQHPRLQVPDVDLLPLPDVLDTIPGAKVMVLNYKPSATTFARLADCPGIAFEIARVEGTDGVAKMLRSAAGQRVMFGTHAPFLIYESALIKAYESNLTGGESQALFEQNAARWLAAV